MKYLKDSMSDTCPYCNQYTSLVKKDVFCSHHQKIDPQMGNNLFYVEESNVSGVNHISRNTFRYSFNGYQHYTIDGKKKTLSPNSVLFIRQGQEFSTETKRGSTAELMTVSLNEHFLHQAYSSFWYSYDELLDEPSKKVKIPEFTTVLANKAAIIKLFSILKWKMGKNTDLESLDADLQSLVVHFFRIDEDFKSRWVNDAESKKKSTKVELDNRLSLAREYLLANLTTPLDLTELSREVGMSKYHFLRLFKKKMGISPIKFLKQERMNYGKSLLKSNSYSVNEVANMLCYESSSAFFRAFKKTTGIAPSEYN